MPLVRHAAHGVLMPGDLLADQEEGRLGAPLREAVEQLLGGLGPWAVVEGQRHIFLRHSRRLRGRGRQTFLRTRRKRQQRYGEHEDTVRRMADEGHQVGSHTFTHMDLSRGDPAERLREIAATDETLRALVRRAYTAAPAAFSLSFHRPLGGAYAPGGALIPAGRAADRSFPSDALRRATEGVLRRKENRRFRPCGREA